MHGQFVSSPGFGWRSTRDLVPGHIGGAHQRLSVGEVAEWSKAPVSKTGMGQPIESSNLSLSALMIYLFSILAAYLLFCKAWPYFLYPNYFRTGRVETYTELTDLARGLRGADRIQTLENVYGYMQRTYAGSNDVRALKSLVSLFHTGDFSTRKLLNVPQFLWCHTQNRLMKSLLVNTGMFDEDDIQIHRRFFRTFFIHQWICVNVEDRTVMADPYYNVFSTAW
jgi:hypothetical protein